MSRPVPSAPRQKHRPRSLLPPERKVLRAPDGMIINAPGEGASAVKAPPQIPAAARLAEVPQRVQIGPTCGLYALGMVMDFWHKKDLLAANPLVQDRDTDNPGRSYHDTPTTDERVLDVALRDGFTSVGEMFTAGQLARVAAHFGYSASVHASATLEQLYRVLDARRPAIVAFDVDEDGNPGDYDGRRAHYAVIEGYFDDGGDRWLVAKHGWGGQEDYVWSASAFDRSWRALESTDFYGTPGDDVIPTRPDLHEPAHLDLPAAGPGLADIHRSLCTKIVEVVLSSLRPIGGETVIPAP